LIHHESIITTSQRQGQIHEERYEGSPNVPTIGALGEGLNLKISGEPVQPNFSMPGRVKECWRKSSNQHWGKPELIGQLAFKYLWETPCEEPHVRHCLTVRSITRLGWLEGWGFKTGDVIEISSLKYRVGVYAIQ